MWRRTCVKMLIYTRKCINTSYHRWQRLSAAIDRTQHGDNGPQATRRTDYIPTANFNSNVTIFHRLKCIILNLKKNLNYGHLGHWIWSRNVGLERGSHVNDIIVLLTTDGFCAIESFKPTSSYLFTRIVGCIHANTDWWVLCAHYAGTYYIGFDAVACLRILRNSISSRAMSKLTLLLLTLYTCFSYRSPRCRSHANAMRSA